MTILTSCASATYKAQIRTSPESGFIAGYQGTCTESEFAAALAVARAVGTVRFCVNPQGPL